MRQDRISDALLPPSGAPAPRLGHALLWTPSYVSDDKILWHVPFLFWLLEATKPRRYVEIGVGEGVAYMAVCQAVHRLRAQTQCYAVGHWRDTEENSGVPDRLAGRNADLYEDFSQILKGGVEASAATFEDGTVDLMLVDLTLDSSLANLTQDCWIPKLSASGILLLNGINQSDTAIASLQEMLASKSATLQMPGGDGLRIFLPGGGVGEDLTKIAALSPDDPAHKLIVQMFTRLGSGTYNEVRARRSAETVNALDDQVRRIVEERDTLTAQLEQRQRQYDSRHRKAALLQSRVFDLQVAAEAARADAEQLWGELLKFKEGESTANQLLELERSAHRDTQRRADEMQVQLESLNETLNDLTERAKLLASELVASRARQEGLSAELANEHSARLQAERERDVSMMQVEALDRQVVDVSTSSEKSYQAIKRLLMVLEENENLVSALTEELHTERDVSLERPSADSIEDVRPSLLDRLIGRKRE